jgi:superfamily I DNA/RNA helicase
MLKCQDSLALRQWLEIIEVHPDEIQQLRRQAMEAKTTLYDFCSKAGLPKLDDLFGGLAHLEASEGDGAQFQRAILEFPDLLVDPNLFPDIGFDDPSRANTPARVPAIIKSIHERFGLLDADSDISHDPRVLVTTLHSAKGLEAEFVFILWLNSDFMPSPGRDAEEERRVLYVALTRAKQDVTLLFHEKFDGRKRIKEDAVSPFLRDISEHLKIARITRADFR